MNTTQQSPPHGSTGKMVGAFLSLLVVMVGEIVGYLASLFFQLEPNIATTLGGGIAGVVMMLVLGGKAYLRPSWTAVRETMSYLWWILTVSAILMVWGIMDYVQLGEAVSPNWLYGCFESLVLCLCIGVAEEVEFRGLVYGGMLVKMGGNKKGIMIATIGTAVLFGSAHISWFDLNITDGYSIVQALLKVVQTGLYSIMLSAIVLKTHNITGAMLLHALDDWLLFVVASGIYGEGYETEYVSTSSTEDAIATIIFYIVIIALYLPTALKALRTLQNDIEIPEFGPFSKASETESSQVSTPALPMPMGTTGPAATMGYVPASAPGFAPAEEYGEASGYEVAPAPGYVPAAAPAPGYVPAAAPAPGYVPAAAPAPGYVHVPAPTPAPSYATATGYAPSSGEAPVPMPGYGPTPGYASARAPMPGYVPTPMPPYAVPAPVYGHVAMPAPAGPIPPDGFFG